MKKLLLILAAFGLTTAVNAQPLKQAGGEKNVEVNFAPLGGSPISIGGIKFRKFNAAGTSAIRLNVFLGLNSSKDITQQKDTGGIPELTTKNSSFNISVRPGYEKHMAGTDRLSPYCGGELAITMNSSKKVEEGANADNTVNKTTTKNADGYLAFGLNAFWGADFYFAKSIYLGAEFGFGFNMKKMSDKKIEYSGFNPSITNPPAQKQGSSFQLGPTYQALIRLGWLF